MKLQNIYKIKKKSKIFPRKIVLFLILPIFFLCGCFLSQEIQIPVFPLEKIKLQNLNELPFVHVIHRGKKMDSDGEYSPDTLNCYFCHEGEVSNKRKRGVPAMSVCLDCHTGKVGPKLSCEQCHLGQKNVFSATTNLREDDMKSPMADLDCVDCHDKKNKLQVLSSVCEGCHDDSDLYKISTIQKKYLEKYTTIRDKYDQIYNYTKIAKNKKKTLIDIYDFKAGEYYYKYALLDRSKGVHNPKFAMHFFDKAEKILSKLSNQYNNRVRKLIEDAQSEDSQVSRNAMNNIEAIGGKKALLPYLNNPISGLRIEAGVVLRELKSKQDKTMNFRRIIQ